MAYAITMALRIARNFIHREILSPHCVVDSLPAYEGKLSGVLI